MIGKNQRKKKQWGKIWLSWKNDGNEQSAQALKPLGFLGAMTNDYYFVNESYNEEQGIKIIILRTSSTFIEPISFPVFSTVRRYITLLQ